MITTAMATESNETSVKSPAHLHGTAVVYPCPLTGASDGSSQVNEMYQT